MIQGIIGKKILNVILKQVLKAITKKWNLDKIKSYVEEDNELDLITKMHGKGIDKLGKAQEETDKDMATLKKEVKNLKADSHPPIFKEKDIKRILSRLKSLERKK
jgi:hypothetical protein